MTNKGRHRGLASAREIKPSRWISTRGGKIMNRSESPSMPRFCPKPSSQLSHLIRKDARPMFMEGHNLPVCNPRDKAKETQNLKSRNVAMNQQSTAWRIVNKGVGQNFNGVSATGLLSHLSRCYRDDMDDGIDYGDHAAVEDIYEEWPTFANATMTQSISVEEEVMLSPIVEGAPTFANATMTKSIGVEETVMISPIVEEMPDFADATTAKSISVEETVMISPIVLGTVRISPSDGHDDDDADEDTNEEWSAFDDAKSISVEEMVRICPSEIGTDDDYDMDFDGVGSCGWNEVEDEDWCLVGDK